MEKRSRRRIRDLVTHMACQGLSQNEIGCVRVSMMARGGTAPSKGRIQKRKTNSSIAHIRLATHGRSIQMGHLRRLGDLFGKAASARKPEVAAARHKRREGPCVDNSRLANLSSAFVGAAICSAG